MANCRAPRCKQQHGIEIITNETFTALLLMAVASTMLTVPAVTPKLARMKEIVFRPK